MELKSIYQQRAAGYAAEIVTLKRKNESFVAGELLSFGAMIGFVVCHFAIPSYSFWLYLAVAMLVSYFVVRHFDDKNKEKVEHLSALLAVCQKEVQALDGDFSAFDAGESYQNPQHPYSYDLDIFGTGSLYQRICRTITSGGSDVLAAMLSREEPLDKDEIALMIDMQEELAGQRGEEASRSLMWRMEYLALGERNEGKIETSAVVSAIGKVASLQVPVFLGTSFALCLGWLLIVGVMASLALAAVGILPGSVPVYWMSLQYVGVFLLCKSTLDKISVSGERLRRQLLAYAQVLRLIDGREFKSQKARGMQASLSEALPSFVQLEQILKGYDRRGNFLGLFFTNALMLSDFFLVRKFLKWKRTYMDKMEEWMCTVSTFDAMVSASDFRFNHPEAREAEIVDSDAIVYEAKSIGHPFLGGRAVRNDFQIADGCFYIVTGANMAGKSTFLRTLGVNYILAMAGLPVFADSLRLSRFRLFSSMRTTDDLTHGISYFNAELLRLQQLIDFCTHGGTHCSEQGCPPKTLIILDEILKGTNSLDKQNGSRLFLEYISRYPVSGVVATHDLELSKMEDVHGARYHNYCFEIDLGTDVTYTYKIQRGVAHNQNATFLLNKILREKG